MHWLAEHAPKYAKYQLTKLGPLTVRDPKEGAKIILKLFFLTQLSNCFFLTLSEQVFKKKRQKNKKQKTKQKNKNKNKKKTKSTIKQRKIVKISYFWFWVHWLAEHAPNSAKYQFIKFGRMTVKYPKKGAKIILKLLFLSRRRVLKKKQRELSNRENWQKWLTFDSGCTGWDSTPQSLLSIDLPNLVS